MWSLSRFFRFTDVTQRCRTPNVTECWKSWTVIGPIICQSSRNTLLATGPASGQSTQCRLSHGGKYEIWIFKTINKSQWHILLMVFLRVNTQTCVVNKNNEGITNKENKMLCKEKVVLSMKKEEKTKLLPARTVSTQRCFFYSTITMLSLYIYIFLGCMQFGMKCCWIMDCQSQKIWICIKEVSLSSSKLGWTLSY